jgi:hypothetical protein
MRRECEAQQPGYTVEQLEVMRAELLAAEIEIGETSCGTCARSAMR